VTAGQEDGRKQDGHARHGNQGNIERRQGLEPVLNVALIVQGVRRRGHEAESRLRAADGILDRQRGSVLMHGCQGDGAVHDARQSVLHLPLCVFRVEEGKNVVSESILVKKEEGEKRRAALGE